MLLDHLGHAPESAILEASVEQAVADGYRTRDLGGETRCSEFGEQVRIRMDAQLTSASQPERATA
jgi:isocitrate/isopropylmalate dehydrogenase